jgi:hypothetical protein
MNSILEGSTYTHKANGVKVIVKRVERQCGVNVIFFIFEDDLYSEDPSVYVRSEREFSEVFSLSLCKHNKKALDEMLAIFGHEVILNYVGQKYKKSMGFS